MQKTQLPEKQNRLRIKGVFFFTRIPKWCLLAFANLTLCITSPHPTPPHHQPGFPFFMILLYSQSGNHPENNLAKFGYKLDIKVVGKKKQ
jgi:hypothetical protein